MTSLMLNSGDLHENSLAESIILFSRILKDKGFLISTPSIMDALSGVRCLGIEDRQVFKIVLRSTFMTRQEESALFDRLFEEFWVNRFLESELTRCEDGEEVDGFNESDQDGPETAVFLSDENGPDSHEQQPAAAEDCVFYSPVEILRQQNFKDIPEGYDYRMAKLVREIASPLLKRISRRRRPVESGIALDLRRIFRRNIKYGGDIYELPGLKPKLKIKKLVFLCDVSGSMSTYQKFMLRFIKELQHLPTRVETFVFATDLHRITPLMQRLPFSKAMEEVGRCVRDWSGGTRIGQSLQKFTSKWGDSLLRNSTVVLIHSDGWDRGDSQLLESEMARIHRRAYRVVWINPLLGGESYEPTCRGMRIALPHVDYFLPGHNLLSLERISGTVRGFL